MRHVVVHFRQERAHPAIVWETTQDIYLYVFQEMGIGHGGIHSSDDRYDLLCYAETALSISLAGISHSQGDQNPSLAHQPMGGLGCQRFLEIIHGLLILARHERSFPGQLQPAGAIKFLDECVLVKVERRLISNPVNHCIFPRLVASAKRKVIIRI